MVTGRLANSCCRVGGTRRTRRDAAFINCHSRALERAHGVGAPFRGERASVKCACRSRRLIFRISPRPLRRQLPSSLSTRARAPSSPSMPTTPHQPNIPPLSSDRPLRDSFFLSLQYLLEDNGKSFPGRNLKIIQILDSEEWRKILIHVETLKIIY